MGALRDLLLCEYGGTRKEFVEVEWTKPSTVTFDFAIRRPIGESTATQR
jgi:hypothetical protein